MKHYNHLSLDEREKLYLMKKEDKSIRTIAIMLKRSPSSISRELRRNVDVSKNLGYLPDRAHNLSVKRQAKHGTKISRYPELKTIIINRMTHDRWSPQMIAGILKNSGAKRTISAESIYKYVYSPEGSEMELYKQLICRRPRRNQKYGRKTRSNYGIPDRVSISQRPEIKPSEFGHFEADLTFFAGNSKINLLTMVERKTGYFMAELNESKKSDMIGLKLLKNLIRFPKKARKTLTLDNGKEFVMHNKISQITGTPAYFCHPGSPWEKPYVETSHALLHRFIPKKTNSNTLTIEEIKDAVTKLNNLPRKRFNFKTPAEMIAQEKFYNSVALRA
jgi:IS30 family transposase